MAKTKRVEPKAKRGGSNKDVPPSVKRTVVMASKEKGAKVAGGSQAWAQLFSLLLTKYRDVGGGLLKDLDSWMIHLSIWRGKLYCPKCDRSSSLAVNETKRKFFCMRCEEFSDFEEVLLHNRPVPARFAPDGRRIS